MDEPLIHSHITDCLSETHPLSRKTVACEKCGVMVHAFNNECMQTWVETGEGNYCLTCFARLTDCVVDDAYALNRSEAP